jgi:hypothetical protein
MMPQRPLHDTTPLVCVVPLSECTTTCAHVHARQHVHSLVCVRLCAYSARCCRVSGRTTLSCIWTRVAQSARWPRGARARARRSSSTSPVTSATVIRLDPTLRQSAMHRDTQAHTYLREGEGGFMWSAAGVCGVRRVVTPRRERDRGRERWKGSRDSG